MKGPNRLEVVGSVVIIQAKKVSVTQQSKTDLTEVGEVRDSTSDLIQKQKQIGQSRSAFVFLSE